MNPVGKASLATTKADPSHDLLRAESHPLDAIFAPRNVALVGASERAGSVGRNVLWNLLSSPFGGTLYPVNPKRSNVLGVKSYPSVKDLPEVPDLVVVTTPAESVPALMRECVEAGVPGGIVISAGFKETGERGKQLENEVMDTIRGKMRIIGPNCLGVMNPLKGLNATFAIDDRASRERGIHQPERRTCARRFWTGVCTRMSASARSSPIGSMLDVNWGDLIDYFGNDPRSQSIVIYMESIGDARAFLSAAREVSLTKPIIVIKAGRTAAGSQGGGVAHRIVDGLATTCWMRPSVASAYCA